MSHLTRIQRWTRRDSVREHFFPVALIIFITCVFFAPRLLGLTFSAVGHHAVAATYPWVAMPASSVPMVGRGYPQTDHAETYYPLSVFATQAWRSGQLPLWMPYSFGGFPILELGMTSLLYPPRLLLIPFFDPIWQHDLLLFLHLLGAGLGMYALLRAWGCGAAGAVLGAVVWQFNGHNLFWLVIEQMAIVAAWTPLMLLAATLAVRRQSLRWAVAAGLAVGVALYSGGTHYVHWSGWLLALWYGTDVLRAAVGAWRARRTKTALGYLLLPVVSLGVALLVGLAYWLPLLGMLSDIARQPLPFERQMQQAYPLAQMLDDAWLPRLIRQIGIVFDYASFSFVGLGVLALALVGLLLNRSRHVRIAFLFAVCAMAALLGLRPWLRLLHTYLPSFNTMNLHVLFFLYCFAVAVMAAFGLSELVSRWQARPTGKRRWGLATVSALVASAAVFQIAALLWKVKTVFLPALRHGWDQPLGWKAQLLMALLAALAAVTLGFALRRGVALMQWRRIARSWPAAGYALAATAAISLLLYAWLSVPFHPAHRDLFFPVTPLIAKLQEAQQQWRILPLYRNTEAWTPPLFAGKSGTLFGLRFNHGYESLLPLRTTLLWRTVQQGGKPADLEEKLVGFRPYFLHDRVPIRLLENLSIGLLVTPPGIEPVSVEDGRNLATDGTLTNIYRGPDGWIYEDRHALPRAFLVSHTVTATGIEQSLQMLTDRSFDARRTAIIEAPLEAQAAALPPQNTSTADTQPPGTARIVRERINQVEIETSAPQTSLLVLNDSWASGWRASIDGIQQPVQRVNFNARGVLVPGGAHRAVFQYRPPILWWSLGISAVSFLLLLGWLIFHLGVLAVRQHRIK